MKDTIFTRSEKSPNGDFTHTVYKKVTFFGFIKLNVDIVTCKDLDTALSIGETLVEGQINKFDDQFTCSHDPVRIEATVPYIQCSKCFKNLGSAYQ